MPTNKLNAISGKFQVALLIIKKVYHYFSAKNKQTIFFASKVRLPGESTYRVINDVFQLQKVMSEDTKKKVFKRSKLLSRHRYYDLYFTVIKYQK